jgi:hypothetical protein
MTLAMEVDANRKNAIARLFPPHKFVDDDFEPDLLPLTSWDISKVLAVFPNVRYPFLKLKVARELIRLETTVMKY